MNTVITIHHLHGQHNIRGKFGFGNIKWQKPTSKRITHHRRFEYHNEYRMNLRENYKDTQHLIRHLRNIIWKRNLILKSEYLRKKPKRQSPLGLNNSMIRLPNSNT